MQETPMLFPTPTEFWKQINVIMDVVITETLLQQKISSTNSHLRDKALLKATDFYAIFQISRPTLHEWLKQNKIKSIGSNQGNTFPGKIL